MRHQPLPRKDSDLSLLFRVENGKRFGQSLQLLHPLVLDLFLCVFGVRVICDAEQEGNQE